MDSTLLLEHITACQGRNEDAFNFSYFSLHLSKAQVDREQQYRDGHWHARHLEDATNAKRKFKDVLGYKVFCYWIPLPASYRSYGWWFDHIPPVKRIWVSWSSWTSASLDYDQDLLLCWTSHEISTHYSRSLQLSRREKSHHPNWLCQLHKKRRFASTFQVFPSLPKQPNSEDVHLCFIYPSKQTQVYCQRKGVENATKASGVSIVCWEKYQLKLTTVKVRFW